MAATTYQQPDKWGTPIIRDFSGLKILRDTRSVRRFWEMPTTTQAVYLEVAKCFPGVRVWACGSRVRGDYVEVNDKEIVRQWRVNAGMKNKAESDFDFWINGAPHPVRELPANTEQVKCRVPDTEKVAIPIYVGLEKSA